MNYILALCVVLLAPNAEAGRVTNMDDEPRVVTLHVIGGSQTHTLQRYETLRLQDPSLRIQLEGGDIVRTQIDQHWGIRNNQLYKRRMLPHRRR